MSTSHEAVNETDEKPKADSEEVNNAPSNEDIDLDALLAEFGSSQQKPEGEAKADVAVEGDQPSTKTQSSDIGELLDYVRGRKQQDEADEAAKVRQQYKDTVKSLKGDLDVPDIVVDGFLRVMGEDHRIRAAYQNRFNDPKGWSKVEEGLRRELKKTLTNKVDTSVTNTRKAVAEAIQQSQTEAGVTMDYDNLGQLNDVEFNKALNDYISS